MKKCTTLIAAFVLIVPLVMITGCNRHRTSVVETTDFEESDTLSADTDFSDVVDFSHVDTTSEAVFREASLSSELQRRAKEALKPVYFEYDRFTLTDEALERIQIIDEFMRTNSAVRILIEGHCDERGTSAYNMGLGERRAKAVRDYLVSIGIDPIRIEITSYGKENPAKSGCEDDELCHSLNRRAEFRPLGR
ncbi:OmpA family protein [Chitinispirillales bacterium ANBcel5]|uniref:OmpA family protein n=1 Tax=Cellulosispirillum alkaliphilum TaxID=3039283 RepID=UPI002A549E7C|nr:OmpA family protein [Chitinispirillales bacterium ANBcel5]